MYTDGLLSSSRINARQKDAFDIFNLKHYVGPNPYLKTAALVFDFAETGFLDPLPLQQYLDPISHYYPILKTRLYGSAAELFVQVVVEANCLNLDLHLTQWSLQPRRDKVRLAVQTLHARTTHAVVYLVWDWFEAITQNESFDFKTELTAIQKGFRESVYGGPTVYALLRAAYQKGIPTFYLWKEGLVQYGYGRKQVRGASTTFDVDSNLDSDFTTRKDDCKDFLEALGFPVPMGSVVTTIEEALKVSEELGYPLVVKPVIGHKGMGVTAGIQTPQELAFAFTQALAAIPRGKPTMVIVEKYIVGTDFRLLCIQGQFVAAVERRPASVLGNGYLTIQELIDAENNTPARLDTPTSPLGKILCDEVMDQYLAEQKLTRRSVLAPGQRVFLRKVANLSAGGVSLDATRRIHPDNVMLAQDIAQYFRLTCLGIDVITENLSVPWREGHFGIIEINAAPGIFMHLKPAVGESVDVASSLLNGFFPDPKDSLIPIITFNLLSLSDLHEVIDLILYHHPTSVIGGICREGSVINRVAKHQQRYYNANVESLLRHPRLDLLIAEYDEDILEREGLFYQESTMVILDNPSHTEMLLARTTSSDSTLIIRKDLDISIQSRGVLERYSLAPHEPFKRVYLKEIARLI
jgi:cyanophycin synthetase